MKKWLKWVLGILATLLLAALGITGWAYYNMAYRYTPSSQVFTHKANHIDPATALLNQGFTVCDDGHIYDYYNDDSFGYKGSKGQINRFIKTHYKPKHYTDSGYLNIRFVVNCEGQAGRYVIHQNNLDLEPTSLNKDLVNQLFRLTSQLQDWNPLMIQGSPKDCYMYISYRIEDGQITEILP